MDKTAKLQNLIIYLCLLPGVWYVEGFQPKATRHCSHYLGPYGPSLKNDMLASSTALADQAPPSLKTLRVIYDRPRTIMLEAVDYVPVHRVTLIPPREDWDYIGESVAGDGETTSTNSSSGTSENEDLHSFESEEEEE